LNELGGGNISLPTMRFLDKGAYSYVEFQKHDQEKGDAQAKLYYKRYGQLAVAAKLMGVNDLHYENVMSLAENPTIIDAETAFLPYIMDSEDFGQTGIAQSMSTVLDQDEDLANSGFYVKGESDDVTDERRTCIKAGGKYHEDFKEGIASMMAVVRDNADAVRVMMEAKFSTTGHIRVVPLRTQDFKDDLKSYRNVRPEYKRQILDERVVAVRDGFVAKGFNLEGGALGAGGIIKTLLTTDYDNGDIPIFHFEPAENALKYHNQLIGRWTNWGDRNAKIIHAIGAVAAGDVATITGQILASIP
jgi:hypothetical protein